jgi:hypothetical protein
MNPLRFYQLGLSPPGVAMWRDENRGRDDRGKLRYPNDLTDDEWSLIAPLIYGT